MARPRPIDPAARVRETMSRKTPAPTAEPVGKRVRFTADLDVETHRWLSMQAAEHGLKLVAIVRAAIAELREDPKLLNRVLTRAQRAMQ